MIRGWIRLWRKAIDNDIIKDPTAWHIFTWLLLKVDKTTGEKTIGRFWASEELNIKPSTFYKALKRLEEKYKVVTLTATTKNTKISFINWYKYQSGNSSGNNKVTTKEQQSNTLQEYKNKELKNNNDINIITLTKNQLNALKRKFPYQDVDLALQKFKAWQQAEHKEFKNPMKRFEMWLIDDQRWHEKKTNSIISDPIFIRLQPIYNATIGAEWEAKSNLIDRLNNKYPVDKYQKEWDEAKKILRGNHIEERKFDTSELIKKMSLN